MLTYWANGSPASPEHVKEASGQLAHERGDDCYPKLEFLTALLTEVWASRGLRGALEQFGDMYTLNSDENKQMVDESECASVKTMQVLIKMYFHQVRL